MKRTLTTFSLAMLITGSIDSIRNMPAVALFGPQLIFFFIFGAIFFLLPAGLVSAELASTKGLGGGVYHWVKTALGKPAGVFTIWLQWINTMVWYPTILSFIAGTAAYLIDPHLAANKLYLVSVILVTFWILTLINLKGVGVSAKFASFCAVIGMIVPVFLIIIMAVIWVGLGHPMQVHFTAHNFLPDLRHGQSWISLTAIMTAFLGMELATVHLKDVQQPQKAFPKALRFAVFFILGTMICGSLAIAIVLPHNQINLVDGVMEVFAAFFHSYHITWMIPVLTVMLLVGSLGGMVNWIISPAKGLLQAGEDGYLPTFFSKLNNRGVAHRVLLTQAILVTFICLAFLLMPSVNGSYWLLTDLSTQLYVLMYVLMFIAALCLRCRFKDDTKSYMIGGHRNGIVVAAICGFIGCATTLTVGFFPPADINVGSAAHYELTFTAGIILMLLPVLGLYLYRYLHRENRNK